MPPDPNADRSRGRRTRGTALVTGALIAVVAGIVVVATRMGTPTSRPSSSRGSPAARVEVVETTAGLGERLAHRPGLVFTSASALARTTPVITVDDSTRYQAIVGVGTAMTDASAWLIQDQLSAATRNTVLRNLFGASGIGIRVLRLPMGASDFVRDGRPYSYDSVPRGQADPRLARFSVVHDDAYIVPAMREALGLDPDVKVLATPWSPPAWMKANQKLSNVAGSGRLLPGDYGPLARYFVKFVQAYAARGIRIAAITPENEPGTEVRYPGLQWAGAAEATFIANNLAPALAAADLHPLIYAPDANWLRTSRAQSLLDDTAARGVLAGLAWHCYQGNPAVMSAFHRLAPRLEELVTECSPGLAPGTTSELLIASIRNWASSVVLWNLALDTTGGPVQRPNRSCPHCTGLVKIDRASGRVTYTADYYELGQLGQFVMPGARRIGSNSFVSYVSGTFVKHRNYATAGLDDVAFENPDGSEVLLAYNGGKSARRFAVSWHRLAFTYALPAGATVTFKWR